MSDPREELEDSMERIVMHASEWRRRAESAEAALLEERKRAEAALAFQAQAVTERDAALARVAALEKALKHLLDDWERTSAGFPQHIELRYACRDGARAALGADKGAP